MHTIGRFKVYHIQPVFNFVRGARKDVMKQDKDIERDNFVPKNYF
jgi:hypothetical protein